MLRFFARKGGKIKEIIYGENYTTLGNGALSVHAEQDAISKISTSKHIFKKTDLLVIRLSKLGKLGPSKPCKHCIYRLGMACEKYNFSIQYVYYSNSEGDIVCEKFSDLVNSDQYISSGIRKKIEKNSK